MLLQLDSLYYTPDINIGSGARQGVTTAIHALLWIPQVIWALLAVWQLIRSVKKLGNNQTKWPTTFIPYAMVLLVILFFWSLYGVKLGSIHRFQQGLNRAMFKDSVLPSLWAIPLLVLVHVMSYLYVVSKRQTN